MNNDMTFENRDEYNRKIIAEKIISLLESPLKISPIVIDGDWGTGKTEFSKKLAALIEKNESGHKVVYIDAFTEDHNDAPILTIMAAIVALYPESEKKELISKALPALRFGLKTVLKAGAGWILKQNADDIADEFEDAIKDAANSAIDGTVEALLDDHIEAKKHLLALKEVLAELTSENKITIIIDELDRCKPSFAISIIENIKHVFDTENLNFLLVANISQLKASINHIYGAGVDSERYLDKFIKFTYSLPVTFTENNYDKILASNSHFRMLCNESERLKEIGESSIHIVQKFIELKGLSLREVETLSRYLEIYQILSQNKISNKFIPGYCCYRTLAVILYSFGRELALNYVEDKIDAQLIINFFGVNRLPYQTDQYNINIYYYALFGITYKYMPEGSPLLPSENDEKNRWAEISDYHILKGNAGVEDPVRIFKNTLKVFLLQ
ncbi:NTPase [Escherichia coli]|uniref:KAP family P-loop NTPase fold protein n=1 Tax=Escherichia coli TaxID=562 RepID=UPI000B7ED7F3|nr:P-loop NTPase fold protein [Escherichia coli]EEQ5310826.1 NTPase [Escherichia coli]EER5657158.1 NTPase [Escherichia coli]EEV6990941.1 NTPase [Escherichia coli]EFB2562537.1 NTPase [Escherichia coli]EHF0029044.1 NTPase [Escherichia coli]